MLVASLFSLLENARRKCLFSKNAGHLSLSLSLSLFSHSLHNTRKSSISFYFLLFIIESVYIFFLLIRFSFCVLLDSNLSSRRRRRPTAHHRRETTHKFPLRRFQNLERAHQVLIDSHHRPGVIKLPAIIRSRKDRHELPLPKDSYPFSTTWCARTTKSKSNFSKNSATTSVPYV